MSGVESARLHDYLGSTLLPMIGMPGRAFTVAPPPHAGTRSSLYVVRAEAMPPLLLRAFRRRRQASRNVAALRHMDAVGLPAPRLVFHDLGRASRWLGRRRLPYLTIETWIEGARLSSLSDPDQRRASAMRAAALLARFRLVTRRWWGPPAGFRLDTYAGHTLAGARRMLRALAARGVLDAKEAASLRRRFGSWRASLGRLRAYNLVHKDANPHNFILVPGGDVVPVDLHRIAYEPFPEEVMNALHHFCPGEPDLAESFLRVYFTGEGAQARALFESMRDFFEPLYYLKKLYRRATDPTSTSSPLQAERWLATLRSLPPAREGA